MSRTSSIVVVGVFVLGFLGSVALNVWAVGRLSHATEQVVRLEEQVEMHVSLQQAQEQIQALEPQVEAAACAFHTSACCQMLGSLAARLGLIMTDTPLPPLAAKLAGVQHCTGEEKP